MPLPPNKDTKAGDIYYRTAKLGRAETDVVIFAADERYYSSAPIATMHCAAHTFYRAEIIIGPCINGGEFK